MTEIWKDIDNFEGYQISSFGKVRCFRDFHGNITDSFRILNPIADKDGYLYVDLYKDGKQKHKRIHRLVAEAFLEPQKDKVVNHIDGNKINNRYTNLEWVTPKENSTHASENGLYKTRPIKIVETGEIFDSVKECAKALRVHPSDINHAISGSKKFRQDLSFEYVADDEYKKMPQKQFLYDYQYEAVKNMKDGCILNGGVGSGKSRTALYYYFKENGGNYIDTYEPMEDAPLDLYIITTARKRDTLEWEDELACFLMSTHDDANIYSNKVVVDSWNNITKYADVKNAFFIFDEQRVVGNGTWVKAFLKIAKHNRWILASATAGDTWQDYIPVFIANGFYKNRTHFSDEHIIWKRFSKFPQVDRYINTGRLIRLRNSILVNMDFNRKTISHHEDVYVNYDISKYKDITRNRWDIWEDKPIENAGGLCYAWRKLVNTDESRQVALLEIVEKHPKAIIFYNFDYELDILKNLHYGDDFEVAEWNGHKHQPIPETDKWVYLVQYNAGAEGWNCIKTDTVIFYSQNYSYKVMAQSSGRIDRLNTPFTDLYYYHLKSRSGIDLAISRTLKDKKKFNETKFVNSYSKKNIGGI